MEHNNHLFISFQNLRDMFSDDQDLYDEFLKVCMSSISQNMDEIMEAAQQGKFAVISTIRHSMKPTFQSLELDDLIRDLWLLQESDPHWPEHAISLVPVLKKVNQSIQLELQNHP